MIKKSLVFLIISFTFQIMASELIFKKDGKVVQKLSLKKIKSGKLKIAGTYLGSIDKTLFNAWRGYERTYRGYSFSELMNAVYGADWKNAKVISFASLDGYRQQINLEKMLNSAQGKKAYIAYTETGKKGFTPIIKKKKIVDSGPLYMVWSNFSNKDKASHGDHLKWPYQLKTIDLKIN